MPGVDANMGIRLKPVSVVTGPDLSQTPSSSSFEDRSPEMLITEDENQYRASPIEVTFEYGQTPLVAGAEVLLNFSDDLQKLFGEESAPV